jgi:hypothetical protein
MAATAATQAVTPATYSAGSPPVDKGSLSGSPVMYMSPDNAMQVRELPRKPL